MTAVRDNVPPSTTLGSTIAKTFIGLVLGAILGFVFFFLLSMVGKSMNLLVSGGSEVLGGTSTGTNPLLSVLLLIVTMISTFVGVSIMISTYSMLFGDEYYDFNAMFRYVIMTNIVVFIFFIPVYLVFMGNISTLFFVMALHIALAVYVCSMQLEMMTNPHYSISSSIGATLGLVIAMLMYVVVMSLLPSGGVQSNLHRYVILPPILVYGMMPFGIGLWKMFYTKLYEAGTDTLYLASPSELTHVAQVKEEDQEDEVNVSR